MWPFSTMSEVAGVLAEDFQLAGFFSRIDQLAHHRLRARNDEAGIGIEHAAHHLVFLDQRETAFLISAGDT